MSDSALDVLVVLTLLGGAAALSLVLRAMRRGKLQRQQRYVDAIEDACQAHPGMYEADLERERAKLEQLRK